MKNEYLLIGILLIIIITFSVMSKKVKKKLTRGYRNNNPGNIRLTKKFWRGEIKGGDKAFKKFKDIQHGYRAIFILLRTYIRRGQDTPNKIISVYAPSHENNTTAYIKTIEKMTGITGDEKVGFDDPGKLMKFVSAISYVENGIKANVNDIEQGFKLM